MSVSPLCTYVLIYACRYMRGRVCRGVSIRVKIFVRLYVLAYAHLRNTVLMYECVIHECACVFVCALHGVSKYVRCIAFNNNPVFTRMYACNIWCTRMSVCPYVLMYLCKCYFGCAYRTVSACPAMLRRYLCATMLGVLWTYVSMFGCRI
jgi:hypothetical protein